MKQRRLDQRRDNKDIHRHVAREAGVADLLRDAEPAVDFHCAGVAPLHFRQELRRILLLQQDAAHAAAAKIDREGQAHGSGADNDDFCVQRTISVVPGERVSARPGPIRRSLSMGYGVWVPAFAGTTTATTQSILPPENLRPGTVRK